MNLGTCQLLPVHYNISSPGESSPVMPSSLPLPLARIPGERREFRLIW